MAEFKKQYDLLNTRQREAVDAIDGPVMVIAGPGTGKTKILTLRIANILDKTDTEPEAILALTFTESGAAEMRGRLANIIGPAAYRVTMTTFHSFCNDIIHRHPESFSAIAGATPTTETDQFIVLQELLATAPGLELLRPTGAPLLYLKAVRSAIDTLKREGISGAHLTDIANGEESTVINADDLYHDKGRYKGTMKGIYSDRLKQIAKLRELAGLYDRYQAVLRERRLYDYNDMILEVARALSHDEQLRLMLQERYQYILVDEHQDTNNAQNNIIEQLASFWERPNLFVVGDARQAIYRFHGASLENFLYFKNLYPDVTLVELGDNYRSSQSILNAAGTGLTACANRQETPVEILVLSDQDTERYAVATHIAGRLTHGVQPEDIAVLFRDNADGQILAGLMNKLRIPYTISSDTDVLEDTDIRKLILILEAVRDYGQPGPLLTALHVDTLGLHPLDIYKLSQERDPYAAIRTLPAGVALARWHTAATNDDPIQAFEAIVRESGILAAILATANAAEKLSKLHTLYDIARSLVTRERSATLMTFVDHLRFIRDNGLALKIGGGQPLPHRVRLMTAHRSKGLEFDHVYIIGATDDHWGPRNHRELIKLPEAVFLKGTIQSSETSEEVDEQNLFYVALTRARRTATVTYASRDLAGRGLPPSRYITDIRPELTARPDTAGYEADWASHREVHFTQRPATAPDIVDKAYLNDIFRRQGLSATALNNYLACPWKYFYRNLVRIPEAPTFPLMYGSAVDRALQEYFERLRLGQNCSKASMLASFSVCARRQPFSEQELAGALAKGERALSGYFDRYHEVWRGNILNQFKVSDVTITLKSGEDVILNGKMDRVDILDAANRVVVTDYKTGRPKSRDEIAGLTKDATGDYLRQLTFYQLLLDNFRDGYYAMNAGVVDFVDPDERGNYRREEFIIEKRQTDELTATICRVAREILELAFWDSVCSDKKCRYCELRRIV